MDYGNNQKVRVDMTNKIKVGALLIVCIIAGCISVKDEIRFHKNRYGYSEVQVMDLTFSISDEYDDGPYVFYTEKGFLDRSVVQGKLVQSSSKFTYPDVFEPAPSNIQFEGKIAALSDIHGQFEVFTNLLKANQIIDDKLRWSFGDGMLVITGDVFDRGPKVLDTLWMLYRLEQEAKQQGGQLHLLLGNHEYMVLTGDLRYLHPFYEITADLMGKEYHHLFGTDSVLGRWLRAKSTILKVNDTLFMHGGLSPAFVEHGLDFETINEQYRKSIDTLLTGESNNPAVNALHDRQSPIWYRGYFYGNGLEQETLDAILEKADVSRIVVGHTSMQSVKSYFNNKVLAVDTSIKKGMQGELLFIQDNNLTRATYQGEKIAIN